MRCVDLTGTWDDVRDWLDRTGVLVLPRLAGDGPTVRLDGDLDPERPATPEEAACVLDRLRQVIQRFAVPAVYVGQVRGEPGGPPSRVTVRVMAGGVLHELTLAAAWHVECLFDTGQGLVSVVG